MCAILYSGIHFLDERDFSEVTLEPIIFTDGQLITTVSINIIDDHQGEGMEWFSVHIELGEESSNLSIFAPNATVYITDNEGIYIS